ncbi:MAG: T9SS type A sorting domain-containing protein [Candidatus Kapabacteria bacterium]|nr:T9SS type A sorting domain-containing protein [Candidatus Kapabacteria bacterium]
MKKYSDILLIELVLLFFLVISSKLIAQPWVESLPQSERSNFNSIQQSFYDYEKLFDASHPEPMSKTKGSGYKIFKRWENFWQPRVSADGSFPNSNINQTELIKWNKNNHKQNKNNKLQSANWAPIGPSTSSGGYAGLGRVNCVRALGSAPSVIWAGAAAGGVWKSQNGGISWTCMLTNISSLGISDIGIDPTNSNHVYIATGDNDHSDTRSIGVYETSDGGASWNPTGLSFNESSYTLIYRLLIHPTTPNIIYASTSVGVYKTTNGGVNWSNISSYIGKDLEFKPGDPNTIYGSSNIVFRTTDGGTNWSQLTTGLPSSGIQRIAIAVTPANSAYIYALISNGNSGYLGMYRSTDAGNNWVSRSTSPNILDGTTNGSGSGGQAWYDLCIAVSNSNAELVFTGGVNIWKSTNGGQNWTINTMWYAYGSLPTVHADQHELFFIPGTSTLFNGNDGGVYRTTDYGSSWTWMGNDLQITQFYKLGITSNSPVMVIAGAQDNGTKLYNSGAWNDVNGGDGMECFIDFQNNSTMYCTTQNGSLNKSTDGGNNFFSIKGSIGENGAWVTPFLMSPSNNNVLFAGFVNVWRSANGGTSWSKISSFSGSSLSLVTVAPSNANYICAYVSSVINKTTNGGTAWTTIALPFAGSLTGLIYSQTDAQKMWATFSGYSSGNKVFYSSDGGNNWTNISANLPNVPVNCVVYQEGTSDIVFVGTDIGVFTYDPSIGSWQSFSDNMPSVVVDDLAYNYNTNTLYAATFGRGIWYSTVQVSQPISSSVLTSSLCSGTSLNVNYQIYSTYNSGNIFTAQLSDASGNFTSPVNIGTLTTTNAGTINATIPIATSTGTGYRVRVTSSNPSSVGTNNGSNIAISTAPNTVIRGKNVVCKGDIITFNTSAASGVNNLWSVTNAFESSSNYDTIYTVRFNTLGTCKVKLIQSVGTSCSDADSMIITVSERPNALINGELSVCNGSESIYTSAGASGFNSTWTINGGITKIINDSSVTVQWSNPGTGTVKLVRKNLISGCSDSSLQYITINPQPTVTVNGSLQVCKNSVSVYKCNNVVGTVNSWTVTGGKVESTIGDSIANVLWDNIGKGTITVIKVNGLTSCNDSAVINITINSKPVATMMGAVSTCVGTTENYSSTLTAGQTTQWIITGGTILGNPTDPNIKILWNNAGAGTVKLIVNALGDGCSDTISKSITVNLKPIPQLTGNSSACLNDSVTYNFNGVAGIISDFILTNGKILSKTSTSLQIQWNQVGAGSIKLIQTNATTSCKDSITSNITIYDNPPKPTISRSLDTLISSSVSGNQWYIDGQKYNGATFRIFLPPIRGLVTLIVTNQNGCVSVRSDEYNFRPGLVQGEIILSFIENISIYPNPADKIVNISFDLSHDEIINIKILDVLGRNVKTFPNILYNSGKINLIWDCTNGSNTKVDAGVYLINFETIYGKYSQAVIVN